MRRDTLLFALVLALACSAPPEPPAAREAPRPATPLPSVAEATELIGNSAELGEFEFTNAGYSLPLERANRSAPAEEVAKALEAAGWIDLPAGTVGLNGRSKSDKRFLLRPNGILDVVPLAKKEMGTVASVTANPDGTAVAPFSWRWLPNDVGAPLADGPLAGTFQGEQRSKATLIWDGTSWSVLRIER